MFECIVTCTHVGPDERVGLARCEDGLSRLHVQKLGGGRSDERGQECDIPHGFRERGCASCVCACVWLLNVLCVDLC